MCDKNCLNCKYWVEFAPNVNVHSSGDGECHRHAPCGVSGARIWPETSWSDWCGEFMPMEPETLQEGS